MEDQIANGGRQAPIDISSEQFRSTGHVLIDRIADLLATLRERKVTAGFSVREIQHLINAKAGMPENGSEVETLLSQTTDLLTKHSLYNGHPKFPGYVTSSPAPIGM